MSKQGAHCPSIGIVDWILRFGLVLLFSVGGCASQPSITETRFIPPCSTEAPPAPDGAQPANLGLLKLQLVHYKCSGAYERDVEKVILEAQTFVLQRARSVAKPAVILDIDETTLSNWDNLRVNDFGFFSKGECTLAKDEPCSFRAWILRAEGSAIASTRRFYAEIKKAKVAVFFVSSRFSDDASANATRANLEKEGFTSFDGLRLKAPEDRRRTKDFKTDERRKIAAEGYSIIANIGDQVSDLEGGFAERTFKLPNPFYFIP